jgi:GTPase SAR1 family protein
MSLKDKLDSARKQITQEAGTAIDGMTQVACDLKMDPQAARLKKMSENLCAEQFNLIMIGRFKNGKSTLMNALLGRTTHDVPQLRNRPPGQEGPMPVDDLPCTATLTRIRYSETPWVKMWRFDQTFEKWTFEEYVAKAPVRDNEEENVKFFGPIREFEVGFPASLCQSGVTMIDAPGTDDVAQRTAVTRQALLDSDAAIVVYRSDSFGGTGERTFVAEDVSGNGVKVFTVVNMYHSRLPDERFRGFVWNRLIKDEGKGPAYQESDKNFATHDIYFVDALKGLQGKWNNNSVQIQESGLELFEERLTDFLLKERLYTHVERYVRNAIEREGPTIILQSRQLRETMQRDKKTLEQAYEVAQAKFKAIRERRDRMTRLFNSASSKAANGLKYSFSNMIYQLRRDLPAELATVKLPSDRGVLAAIYTKKMVAEAGEACGQIIRQRIKEWQENPQFPGGAQLLLGEIVRDLVDNVQSEVADIDRELREIQFTMTGVDPQISGAIPGASPGERIIAGIGGLLMLDPSMVLGGGMGGWRGLVGVFVGKLAASILLVALGVTSAAIIIPVMIVAAIVAALFTIKIDLSKRVKKLVLDNAMKELENAPSKAEPGIDKAVQEMFADLERKTMAAVMEVIHEEEQQVERMIEQNKQDQAGKAKTLALLIQAEQRIEAHQTILRRVLGDAKKAC